jgi:hypothetical protein
LSAGIIPPIREPEFHFETARNHISEDFHISQSRRRIPVEKKFLIRSNLKETELYEKSVVPYVDKIVRVKELVGVIASRRFCVRLGANGWI